MNFNKAILMGLCAAAAMVLLAFLVIPGSHVIVAAVLGLVTALFVTLWLAYRHCFPGDWNAIPPNSKKVIAATRLVLGSPIFLVPLLLSDFPESAGGGLRLAVGVSAVVFGALCYVAGVVEATERSKRESGT
jgi:hypothetical protein